MRSSWIIRLAAKPMTGGFKREDAAGCRRECQETMEGETAVTSVPKPRNVPGCGSHQELREKHGMDSCSRPSGGANPANTSILDVRPPEPWEKKFLFDCGVCGHSPPLSLSDFLSPSFLGGEGFSPRKAERHLIMSHISTGLFSLRHWQADLHLPRGGGSWDGRVGMELRKSWDVE